MEDKSKTIGLFEQIRNAQQPEPMTASEFEKAIKKMEKDAIERRKENNGRVQEI